MTQKNDTKIDAMKTMEYWNSFYSRKSAPQESSSWADFCLQFLETEGGGKKRAHLIDLGCGNARDTLFFAEKMNGFLAVTGIDQSVEAVEDNRERAESKGLQESSSFFVGDFTDPSVLLEVMPNEDESCHFYSRFTLHAVPKVAADRLLHFIAEQLRPGSFFFMEARSVLGSLYGKGDPDPDGDPDAWISGHYRRFIRKDELVQQLRELGLDVLFQEERDGLSAFGGDDPVLVRLIARKGFQ